MENRKRNAGIAQLDTKLEDQKPAEKLRKVENSFGEVPLPPLERPECPRGNSTFMKHNRGKSSVEFNVNWEVLSKPSFPEGIWNAQAMILQNAAAGVYDLYVGGGLMKSLYQSTTLKLAQDMKWDLFVTPVSYFALTTYNSYPVLVGGQDILSRQLSKKLWVFTSIWSDSEIPPMSIERRFASAVNYKGHLIVAGGRGKSGAVNNVEVFNGIKWRDAHALPKACYLSKTTVFNGHWYLIGGVDQGNEVYCTQLDMLIHTTPTENPSAPIWKKMTKFPLEYSSLGVLSNSLIGIGGKSVVSSSSDNQSKGTIQKESFAYYTYSSESSSWIYNGDMPLVRYNCCTVELPTGEILAIGGQSSDGSASRDIIRGKPTRTSDEEFANLSRKNSELLFEIKELKQQVCDLKDQLSTNEVLSSENVDVSSEIILSPNGLHGAEICGETTLVITNRASSFYWKNYGLKVHINKDSLQNDIQQCSINIKASLAGQYEFPNSSRNVSAIYWFRCKPSNPFIKAVAIEIQHCGRKNSQDSSLTFVRCHCTQKQLPYTFKELDNGSFTTASSYGYIKLNHFCGIAVTQDSDLRQYCASMFYVPSSAGMWSSKFEVHFAFTWNTETHLNVLKKHYKEKKAISGPDQEVEFEAESIRLDVPMEGKTIDSQNSGIKWELRPLTAPVVLKKQLDEYATGKRIPCCPLIATMIGTDQSNNTLMHPILLIGAKSPYNFFTIDFTPPGPGPENHMARRMQENDYERDELMKLLEMSDLYDIVQHLVQLEEKHIRRLGGYLGLEHCNLEKMKTLPDDMLAAWLRKEDKVLEKTGPPTMKTLCTILVEKMRQPGIAKKIADSACQVQTS